MNCVDEVCHFWNFVLFALPLLASVITWLQRQSSLLSYKLRYVQRLTGAHNDCTEDSCAYLKDSKLAFDLDIAYSTSNAANLRQSFAEWVWHLY